MVLVFFIQRELRVAVILFKVRISKSWFLMLNCSFHRFRILNGGLPLWYNKHQLRVVFSCDSACESSTRKDTATDCFINYGIDLHKISSQWSFGSFYFDQFLFVIYADWKFFICNICFIVCIELVLTSSIS